MIRPARAQSTDAEVCWRQILASLQSCVRLTEAPTTHRHIRCVRQLLPPPTAAVRCPPLSAFDSALYSGQASSGARLSAHRTPRGLTRSLHIQQPNDQLPHGFDAADAVFPVPRRSPYHFNIRTAQFIGAVALTLTVFGADPSEQPEPPERLLDRRNLFWRARILFGCGSRCYEAELLFAVLKPRALGHKAVAGARSTFGFPDRWHVD